LVRVDQTALGSTSQMVVLYSNLSNRTPAMRTLISIIASRARAMGVVSPALAA
jgi:hypothetical protein